MKSVAIRCFSFFLYPVFLSGAAAKVMVQPHMTMTRIEQMRVEAQKIRELGSRFEAVSLACQAEAAAKAQAALGSTNLAQVQSRIVQQSQSGVVAKALEVRQEKEIARKKAEEEQKKSQEEARIKKQQAENAQKMQELRTLDLEFGRKLRCAWREIHENVDPALTEFRQVERNKQRGDFPLDSWEELENFLVTCIEDCKKTLGEAVSSSEKLCKRVKELELTEEYMSMSGDKGSLLRAKVDAFCAFSYCGYYRKKILSLHHNLRCVLGKVRAIEKALKVIARCMRRRRGRLALKKSRRQ